MCYFYKCITYTHVCYCSLNLQGNYKAMRLIFIGYTVVAQYISWRTALAYLESFSVTAPPNLPLPFCVILVLV